MNFENLGTETVPSDMPVLLPLRADQVRLVQVALEGLPYKDVAPIINVIAQHVRAAIERCAASPKQLDLFNEDGTAVGGPMEAKNAMG